MNSTFTMFYYLTNPQGSVIGLVNGSGAVEDSLSLTCLCGHLILGETPVEGAHVGSSEQVPAGVRREAVELVRTSDRSVIEVARSLGITDSTLHNWLKADRDARERSGDPDALSESERQELARLRRENIELRTDREILR